MTTSSYHDTINIKSPQKTSPPATSPSPSPGRKPGPSRGVSGDPEQQIEY